MELKLDLFGYVVTDMAATLGFYRSLGLDIPAEADAEPHVEITLPGGLRLAWDTTDVIRSFDPEWTQPTGGHRSSTAFLCDSPAAVDAAVAELREAGHTVHHEPWDSFWGQRYATVLDPDGNPVDLFAALETPQAG